MSNLSAAQQTLEKNKKFEAIIGPPPSMGKKARLPLQRDVQLVKSTLDDKLEIKERGMKAKLLEAAQSKWAREISVIHAKAVNLRREIEQLAVTVGAESSGAVTIDTNQNSYGGDYWNKLPQSVAAAEHEDMLELQNNAIPRIEELRKEIDEFIVNIKLGFLPLSDAKALIEKIDQLQ